MEPKIVFVEEHEERLPLITHFAPERVTFNYPQCRRVLKYRKNLYKDKMKLKKMLFEESNIFVAIFHFLHQSALSSFLVLVV